MASIDIANLTTEECSALISELTRWGSSPAASDTPPEPVAAVSTAAATACEPARAQIRSASAVGFTASTSGLSLPIATAIESQRGELERARPGAFAGVWAAVHGSASFPACAMGISALAPVQPQELKYIATPSQDALRVLEWQGYPTPEEPTAAL